MTDDITYTPTDKDPEKTASRNSKTTGNHSGAFSGDFYNSSVSFDEHKHYHGIQKLAEIYNFDLTNIMKVIDYAISVDTAKNHVLCFGMPSNFMDPVISCICNKLQVNLSLSCWTHLYEDQIVIGAEFSKTLPVPDITGYDFTEWASDYLEKKGWAHNHALASMWRDLFQLESYVDEMYQLNNVYRHLKWAFDTLRFDITRQEFEIMIINRSEIVKKVRSQIYGQQ